MRVEVGDAARNFVGGSGGELGGCAGGSVRGSIRCDEESGGGEGGEFIGNCEAGGFVGDCEGSASGGVHARLEGSDADHLYGRGWSFRDYEFAEEEDSLFEVDDGGGDAGVCEGEG